MSKIEQDIKTIDFEQKFVSEGLEYYKYLDEHTQNELFLCLVQFYSCYSIYYINNKIHITIYIELMMTIYI